MGTSDDSKGDSDLHVDDPITRGDERSTTDDHDSLDVREIARRGEMALTIQSVE